MLLLIRTIKYTLTIIFFCGCIVSCWAQLSIQAEGYTQQLTTKDGLPSATIYYLHQDKKGYIWIATDKGLAKYNGSDFEYFTTENGLVSNEILQIYEDYKGRIWFMPFEGGLSYYENDSLFQHPLNSEIETILNKDWVASLYVDKGDTVWFTVSNRRRDTIEYNFFRIYDSKIDTFYPAQDPQSIYLPNKNFIKYWTNPLGMVYSGGLGRGRFLEVKEKNIQAKTVNKTSILIAKKCVITPDTSLVCINSKEYFTIKNEKLVNEAKLSTKNRLQMLTINKKNELLLSTKDGILIPKKNQQLLKDYIINHVIEDVEGNLWAGTSGQGIFMIKNTNIQHWELSKTVSSILITDSLIWMGTLDGSLYYYSDQKRVQELDYGAQIKKTSISNFLELPNNNLLLPSFYQISPDLTNTYICNPLSILVKAMSHKNEKELLLGTSNGLYQFLWQEKTMEQVADFSAWINEFYRVSSDSIWIASNSGLFFYDGTQVYNTGKKYPELPQKLTSITTLRKQVIAGSKGQGLWVLKGEELKNISAKDGLSSNFINVLYQQEDTIWVGTNKGLDRLVFKDQKISIESYLKDIDVQSLAFQEHYLWLGTSDGLLQVNTLEDPKQNYIPPIYLRSIKVSNELQVLKEDYDLAYDQNNIVIDFIGITFRDKAQYRYKLEGVDSNWEYSNIPKVQYPKLPAGTYIFLATVATVNGVWNPNPIRIKFRIRPHFTQTIYFLGLVWSLVIVVISLIAGMIIRSNNRKNKVIRRIKELENKALRSQMNPHFVFNIMNSILYLVNTNQKKAARKYITKFAKLMRRVLEQSKDTLIDLNEEIETIKLYLELEKLRYDGRISSTILIEPKIDLHQYQIPPMFLQPLIENALIHGLTPKDGNGQLTIEFKKVLEDIQITITDDGIGRKAAAELSYATNQDKQTSTGLHNIKERLKQINTIYRSDIRLDIIDLYREQKAKGTQIIVNLPKL